MSDEKDFLTDEGLDAIGEVMNMSMGAAATAVSTMLEKQVIITTPVIKQDTFENIDYSNLDPAIVVRITYVEGIDGENAIVFRKRDMQVILNLLMGNDGPSDPEEFEFDDLSMSAACEVMNQMMGASATALSKILDMPINISTPTAYLANGDDIAKSAFQDISGDQQVVSISFKMMIKDLLDTTFCSLISTQLARRIVESVSPAAESESPAPAPQPQTPPPAMPPQQIAAEPVQPPVPAAQPAPMQQPVMQPAPTPPAQPVPVPVPQPVPEPAAPQSFQTDLAAPAMQPQVPAVQTPAPMQQQAYVQPPVQQPATGYPPEFYQQQGYGMPPMGYAPPAGYPQAYPPQNYPQQPVMNLHNAEFPEFAKAKSPQPLNDTNMGFLMGVKLDVSVVIGTAKKQIRDIIDFGQGTVVELDKQTGAPADIIVNGQLIARGDVMVVGDNFGVRITELTGTKELMDSLGSNM